MFLMGLQSEMAQDDDSGDQQNADGKGGVVRGGKAQDLEPGAALAAVVTAAFHCRSQLVRPPEGADKQGNEDRDQSLCTADQTAGVPQISIMIRRTMKKAVSTPLE